MTDAVMPLPPPSPDSASDHDSDILLADAQAFEQELAAAERSLHELKERYIQVQQDEQMQAQLQERKEQSKRQLHRLPTADLKAELKHLQTQLDALEVNLESNLFSWGSLPLANCALWWLGDCAWLVDRLCGLAKPHSYNPTLNVYATVFSNRKIDGVVNIFLTASSTDV